MTNDVWSVHAGYVGYDEGGQLTEAVRRRPYSVVLFDEASLILRGCSSKTAPHSLRACKRWPSRDPLYSLPQMLRYASCRS